MEGNKLSKERFKNLLLLKPLIKRLIKEEIKELKLEKNKNNDTFYCINLLNEKYKEIKMNEELEKEFERKLTNFAKIKENKMNSASSFKKFIVSTINNLSDLDRSIFLTILFRKNLNTVTWKTFNISKSTFYRRLNFIEKIINWCLFE
ncbi:Hypothetical protein MAU_4800 [Metamycoplasma auris 15026]|uniref:Uncharacterized protein n=1 Tax=Metamycoplasma auris 15026 TaxID=1188233 RepID=N9TRB8_9BACT|nr:hypothetical protein [Metamycoplasma auris]ENY68684.1 Hypothetical protein MAU_4800 [Metamycoplasma auris 15026]